MSFSILAILGGGRQQLDRQLTIAETNKQIGKQKFKLFFPFFLHEIAYVCSYAYDEEIIYIVKII